MLKRSLKVATLDKLLRQELHTAEDQGEDSNFPAQVLRRLSGKAKEESSYEKK